MENEIIKICNDLSALNNQIRHIINNLDDNMGSVIGLLDQVDIQIERISTVVLKTSGSAA